MTASGPEMATFTPALEAGGLTKNFRAERGQQEKVAAHDVSFAVATGACLGLVGESGSGKSTIARMVAGLLPPDRGTIRVDGHQRGRRPARRVARLRYARTTPEESLDVALRLHGERQASERARVIRGLLDEVGLGAREARARPRELSGGQRQRVAIARALAVRPRVLVMDEPVSALDVSVQAQVLEVVDRIRRQHDVAVLFVSHDLAVVGQVSDELIVLRHGRVVEQGGARAILSDPQDPYTRLLLASVPRKGWDLEQVVRMSSTLHSTDAQDG